MSRKSQERRKARLEAEKLPRPKAPPEAVRRRRNRRLLFVALLGLSFPILEAVAYRFRAITITLVNRSETPIRGLKVTYSGGSFDTPEIKPGGSTSQLTRPDFSFQGDQFASYALSIRFAAEGGKIFGQIGRAGTIDFSATEVYTVIPIPREGLMELQLQHTTRPGFPLSLIRDLMERMGLG